MRSGKAKSDEWVQRGAEWVRDYPCGATGTVWPVPAGFRWGVNAYVNGRLMRTAEGLERTLGEAQRACDGVL